MSSETERLTQVDLRSDTVTQPTAAMRQAMADAAVGDDVFGDDPTVNLLQRTLAEQLGYEAGLFFPSGTQSNLAALMTHCQRGDEMIVGQDAHTYRYEGGGAAVLGSIQPQPLENAPDGSIPLVKIAAAIKPDDPHFARTRLLTVENTIGGKAVPLVWCRDATALAHANGMATHLDGARLFNAAAALGAPARDVVAGFDSVSVCLSKGLGTPAGSVLLGTQAFIERAVRPRKMLGGGMRQAGILAAAGLHALEHHVSRLAEDHHHAEQLGHGLAAIDGLRVSRATNMVFVELPEAMRSQVPALVAHLAEHGVIALARHPMRLVTHLGVDDEGVARAIAAFTGWFQQMRATRH